MQGYFDFEWCGRVDANDAEQEKGIDAAYTYCEARGINPAEIWARVFLQEDAAAQDVWLDIESAAIAAMCEGWCEHTENASISWIALDRGRGMTISKAIRHATATVRMHPWGARSYIVETYCPDRHAWIIGTQMPFHAARARLTEKRHAAALVALGWSEHDAEIAAYYCTGSLRDRVKASLGRAAFDCTGSLRDRVEASLKN